MKIHIKNDTGIVNDTDITLENGQELTNIRSINITLTAMEPLVTAQLEFIVPGIDAIAEVTVTKEHLRELAKAHGYELMRMESST